MNGNALFFRDLKKGDKTFTPIVADITNDSYGVIDNVGDKFLIETNHNAPNGKLSFTIPATKTWKDVIPEKPEPLQQSGTAGGKTVRHVSEGRHDARVRVQSRRQARK